MPPDPVFGPLSREEMRDLADAPFGVAAKTLRTFEATKWRVRFSRECVEFGYAIVDAASAEDAERIADELPDSQIIWREIEQRVESEIIDVEPEA